MDLHFGCGIFVYIHNNDNDSETESTQELGAMDMLLELFQTLNVETEENEAFWKPFRSFFISLSG